ncbi:MULTISPECIES: hypothetical protein [unclassified Rhizobium]|jgi:hypothetical protein|uniref:hypothetical protein n=1 Tax=unclassified Rhizobium TaxID=2613769 RepID=UPI000A49F947|nr:MULTISPECIES: hypothetical protein [unclassified Rhizobium]RKD56226.1 hypothetical protein BJ928_111155 [Rhizobium sp. WW_1]
MRYVRVTWKINRPGHCTEILTGIDELNMQTRNATLQRDGSGERAHAKTIALTIS